MVSTSVPTTASSGGGASATRVLERRPGRAELRPRVARHRRRSIELALAIGVPVCLLLLWQIASSRSWIDPKLYPSPTDAWDDAKRLWNDGVLWDAMYISIKRTLVGFAFGSLAGVLVGFAMGMSRLSRAAFEPLLLAMYTVPKLALLPVFLMIFGFGERPIYMLIAVTVFFFVWISAMTAVMAVPVEYREAAATLNANRWQMVRHVLLPGALPQIFVGLRIAAGVSVLMLVGVEFVVGSQGLGFLINQGRQLAILGQAYAGIVLVAVLGYLFALLIQLLGKALLPWASEDNALGPA
jgi:sulfonate transport system permease protein